MTGVDQEKPASNLPLVSAVIIFLNAEKFLAESIDSVLAQTYPMLDLLLVDDGSTDNSTAIASRYVTQFPGRISLLNHPGRENRGMSASRNLGARHAKGEYIAFLDSDDVWLPNKTAEQVAIFQQFHQLGMVYGRTQIWHSWEQTANSAKDFFYQLGLEANRIHEHPSLLATLIENRFQSPTTCNAMISRQAFEALGGFEDSFRGMYEDQAFFTKLYLSYPTYVSDHYWARYRQHAGNSGNDYSASTYYRQRRQLMQFVHDVAKPYWSALDGPTRKLLDRERWRSENPVLANVAAWIRARLKRFRR